MTATFRAIFVFFLLAYSFQVFAINDNTGQCVPKEKWLIPSSGETVDYAAYFSNISKKDVILLGEHHANENHHIWQLNLIKKIYKNNPDLIIGLEMFPRRVQAILDQWIERKIEPKAFQKAVEWDDIWAYDFDFYLPLLTFARENNIKLIAINVDKSLLKMVRKVGWKNIPDQHRMGITDPAKPTEPYVRLLASSFQSHFADPSRITKTGFWRFVQQQLLWDRAMAEALANVRNKNPNSKIIGIVGSWHIIDGYGIPYQLENLNINNVMRLVPWDENLDCNSISPLFADAIYGISENDKFFVERTD